MKLRMKTEKEAQEWMDKKISSVSGEENAKFALEKIKIALVDEKLDFDKAWKQFEKYPRSAKQLVRYQNVWNDFKEYCFSKS